MKEVIEQKLKIPPDYQYNALTKGNFFQRQWHRNRLILVDDLEFLDTADNVADVGCGSGNTILANAEKVASITGFDYNSESINYVKQKLINSTAIQLDISDEVPQQLCARYNKIVFSEVIEHFDETEVVKVLANLRKMLVPGGSILITTPNYGFSLWPAMEFLLDKFSLVPKLWGEQHKSRFTFEKISVNCERAGFSVMRMGTMSLISPFLAILGSKVGSIIAKQEIKYLKFFGPQMYIVAEKSTS